MAFLDETGLAELWSLINAKHARFEIGYYTGTGTYGSDNKSSLTFTNEPKMVFITSLHPTSTTSSVYCEVAFDWTALKVNSGKQKIFYNFRDNQLYVTLSNNNKTINWHSTQNATGQMNTNGYQYQYTAIY